MLFLNASTLFCFSGFAFFFYASLIISILLYVLPTLGENHFNHFSSFNNKSNFYYLRGTSLISWFTQIYLLIGLVFSYCCFFELPFKRALSLRVFIWFLKHRIWTKLNFFCYFDIDIYQSVDVQIICTIYLQNSWQCRKKATV